MAIYAVGDIQGCYDALQRLLDKLKFDAQADQLWIAGDLVNRGPKSLKTLRFVHANTDCMRIVLGNHDLNLLRLWVQKNPAAPPTLQKIMAAPDRDELCDWLRQQPLMHYDASLDTALVHAGILPGWSIESALKRAAEVETVLRNKGYKRFLRQMMGNRPDAWSGKLRGVERNRFIINAFTRMRMVNSDGHLDLRFSGPPSKAPKTMKPWFKVKNRKASATRIVFGHWSALGFMQKAGLVCLDSGCVWDRHLTALQLDKKRKPVSVDCDCD